MLSEQFKAAIRGEIEGREADLAEWRELERLASKLLGPGEGPAPAALPELPPPAPDREEPAPTTPRAAGPVPFHHQARRPRGEHSPGTERKQRILAALAAGSPRGLSAIAEEIGETRGNLARPMRELVAEGQVLQSGATTATVYSLVRLASESPDPPVMSPRVARLEAEASADGHEGEVEIEDQVLDVLRHHGDRMQVSEIEAELRERPGWTTRGALQQAIHRLSIHGLVISDAGGGLRLDPDNQPERPLAEVAADVAGVDSL